MRFIAAAWVVLYHSRDDVTAMFPAWRMLEPVTSTGYYGVPLFFLLSGFVIAYNYTSRFSHRIGRHDYLRFLWLRLARLYPVHLATLLLLGAGVVTAKAVDHSLNYPFTVGSFFGHLFLVGEWLGLEHSWNYPAWSISTEWFAYLLFPFAARAFSSVRSAGASARAATLCLLLLFAGALVLNIHSSLLQVVALFGAGMFLAQVFLVTRASRGWDWVAACAVAALPIVLFTLQGAAATLCLTILFAVLLISLAHSTRGVSRLLSTRPAVFLGEASYSLYMTHALVLMLGGLALSMPAHAHASLPVRLAIVTIYAVAIPAVAIGTYLLLERPARDRLRGWRFTRG